jgi:CheY-like chemotaxis protein
MLNLLDPDTKPTLLVVDDTPENLSLLSALLSPHYRVKVAISGQRALEILSAGTRVDLILLDVVMPQMDGYQVMQALQEMPQVQGDPGDLPDRQGGGECGGARPGAGSRRLHPQADHPRHRAGPGQTTWS